MMENPFIKPGFGWTNFHNNKSKVIIYNGGYVQDLGSFVNAAKFINETLGSSVDVESFDSNINSSLIDELGINRSNEVTHEIFSMGTSNKRKLRFDLMKILPNTAFRMHAHPNVEIIYVISGDLHEFRLQVSFTLLIM